jgi:hypothetical protein
MIRVVIGGLLLVACSPVARHDRLSHRPTQQPRCLSIAVPAHRRSEQPVFVRVVAHRDLTCAVDRVNALHCWGLVGDSTNALLNLRRTGVAAPRLSLPAGGTHVSGHVADGVDDVQLSRSSICWSGAQNHARWCLDHSLNWGTDHRVVPGVTVEPETTFGWDSCVRDSATAQLLCELDGVDGPDRSQFVAAARSRSRMCAADHLGRLQCSIVDQRHTLPSQIASDTGVRAVSSLLSTRWSVCWTSRDSELFCLGTNDLPVSLGIVDSVVASATNLCAIRTGRMRCWDQADPLGMPVENPRLRAADIIQISAGTLHVCALTRSGYLRCVGEGSWGKLGPSATFGEPASLRVTTMSARVLDVRLSDSHTCALLEDGSVWCWGLSSSGQTGVATLTDPGALLVHERVRSTSIPRRVALPGPADAIAVGQSSSCARVGVAVYCWGEGSPLALPATVFPRLPSGWDMIARALEHDYSETLAASQERVNVSEWDELAERATRGRVGVRRARGRRHSCRWDANCAVVCWGPNEFGQLGGAIDPPADFGDSVEPLVIPNTVGRSRKFITTGNSQ